MKMNIREVVGKLSLDVKTQRGDLGRTIIGCHITDLFSDVMANAKEGELWITHQTHPNIVAIAALKNLAGIIVTNNRTPGEETLNKAEEKHITIAVSASSTFEVGGVLYNLLRF